jgi:hypothetical protein
MVDLIEGVALTTALHALPSFFNALLKVIIPGFDGDIVRFLSDKNNRTFILRVVWALSVLLLLFFTIIEVFVLRWITGTYHPGIFLAVLVWSIFFGLTALLFLPSKAITTTFGGLLGISLSEASSAAGLISATNKSVTAVAEQLGAIASVSKGTADPFIVLLVWTTVMILAVLCLPAFFLPEGSEMQVARPPAPAKPPNDSLAH